MRTITDIQTQKRKRERVNVFLNGAFAFSLERELARGLEVGQELSPAQVEELARADLFHHCYDFALRFLSYRPRSQAEVRQRLLRRGFALETVEGVISRLGEGGLVDDGAFARFWRESRETFSPRSRRLIEVELRRKGIDPETAQETIENLDEESSAYRAAQKKARSFQGLDYHSFRHKLASFLQRRGFSWEVARLTVERLWQERTPNPSGS